jgi:hypothetical protein
VGCNTGLYFQTDKLITAAVVKESVLPKWWHMQFWVNCLQMDIVQKRDVLGKTAGVQ